MDDKLAVLLRENNISPDGFTESSGAGDVYSGVLPADVNRVETWLRLAKGAQQSGFFPILRGDPDSVYTGYHSNPQAILADAPAGPLQEILKPLLSARIESLRNVSQMFPEAAVKLPVDQDPVDIDELARSVDKAGLYGFGGRPVIEAQWPTAPAKPSKIRFHTIDRLRDKPCALSMVKVSKGYQAFAHIEFEPGESGLYTPEMLVAIFREWRDQFQIAPAVITGDTIECVVLQPPSTQNDCMTLASQQWVFCEDIVGQGTQSVRNLAMELCNKRTWFFWWD